jgi:site-specific recombinase XerD
MSHSPRPSSHADGAPERRTAEARVSGEAHDDAIDPLTPHEARDVAAGLMLAAGVSVFEVSCHIGHTDINTTSSIY